MSSSSKMEPLAAKTIIVNLATEHGLEMDSITTDRSADLKVMILNKLFKKSAIFAQNFQLAH